MDKQIEKIICPLCGRGVFDKFWAMTGYRLVRCRNCAMVWDYIPPEKLLEQYDSSYFINDNPKGGYANYFEGMRINKKTFEIRLNRIAKKVKKGYFLDVGCALGDCLVIAKKQGWKRVFGVEASEYAKRICAEKKVKIIGNTLDQTKFPKDYFDAIAYQDVIEHITNPVTELKLVLNILKKGGYVFIVTPDISGVWAKILGPLWYHYKPKEHVSYFSRETIKMALKKAGFDDITARQTYHVMSLEYILNRLKYYWPWFFEILLSISKKFKFSHFAFKVYAGELEAWGRKPMHAKIRK